MCVRLFVVLTFSAYFPFYCVKKKHPSPVWRIAWMAFLWKFIRLNNFAIKKWKEKVIHACLDCNKMCKIIFLVWIENVFFHFFSTSSDTFSLIPAILKNGLFCPGRGKYLSNTKQRKNCCEKRNKILFEKCELFSIREFSVTYF